jgi:hypothetical protein
MPFAKKRIIQNGPLVPILKCCAMQTFVQILRTGMEAYFVMNTLNNETKS